MTVFILKIITILLFRTRHKTGAQFVRFKLLWIEIVILMSGLTKSWNRSLHLGQCKLVKHVIGHVTITWYMVISCAWYYYPAWAQPIICKISVLLRRVILLNEILVMLLEEREAFNCIVIIIWLLFSFHCKIAKQTLSHLLKCLRILPLNLMIKNRFTLMIIFIFMGLTNQMF